MASMCYACRYMLTTLEKKKNFLVQETKRKCKRNIKCFVCVRVSRNFKCPVQYEPQHRTRLHLWTHHVAMSSVIQGIRCVPRCHIHGVS